MFSGSAKPTVSFRHDCQSYLYFERHQRTFLHSSTLAALLRGEQTAPGSLPQHTAPQDSRFQQLSGRGSSAMASVACRVQYLDDSDPFICTNFPEPRRPPTLLLEENSPLSEQIAGIHKLLEAPLKVGHLVRAEQRAADGLSS